ncbi:MerR family transcriptional regulator [Oscillatoria amoena NRMC-F 0135]|nr:MerR family transcriptional regulator [Oscillatoria amoena NRMC-F 0135]
MTRFSIKDIECITGIKAHTLRIWEQRYNLVVPKRTDTNIRYYDDEDLRFILNVSILNNYGIKISEIAKMSRDKIREMVLLVSEKDSPHSAQVKALISAMFSLDEQGFNTILSSNILKLGLEETITQVVFPFLHQIGVLWMTEAVHPAHEHFITNLIRQKLYVAIDAQTGKQHPDAKKFLLFLPEGESHEIGLLFANYYLRARGHRVVYLGQNLPYDDLNKLFDFYEPDYVLSSITSSLAEQGVQEFIDKLSKFWPDTTILLTGYLVLNNTSLVFPYNVQALKDVNQLSELVEAAPVK